MSLGDDAIDVMLAEPHVAPFVKAPPVSQIVIGEAVSLVGDQGCTRHAFESSLLCVESFSRAYAGKNSDATKLRHPNALDKAMHFLVQQYLRAPRDLRMLVNHADVWEYLWDRMRQIRTDWTKQLAVSADDPLCLRRIKWLQFTVAGMFVGAAVRSRNAASCVRFMAHKWNYMESVSQTFSDLVVFYRMEGRYRSSEFVSIMALFTGLSLLHKCETHAQFCRWNAQTNSFEDAHDAINLSDVYKELEYHPHMAATRHVRNALRVLHCLHHGGWFEFFELCRVLPWTPLQRCVLFCSFSYVRFRAVTSLLCSRPGKIGMSRFRGVMSVEELTSRLLFDSTTDCKRFLAVILVDLFDHCLDAEQLNLRLCDANYAPMIAEPQHIHENLLNVKQQLSFPPARDFIGFTPFQPLLDLAAQSGGVGFDTSDDVSSHTCPINCMTFLEPYCPSYTPELEALTLADAPEVPWFSEIKPCRREFLGIDRDDDDADDGDSIATASDILDDCPAADDDYDATEDAADDQGRHLSREEGEVVNEVACDEAVLTLLHNAEAAIEKLRGRAEYAAAREERRCREAQATANRIAQVHALVGAEAQQRTDHGRLEAEVRAKLAQRLLTEGTDLHHDRRCAEASVHVRAGESKTPTLIEAHPTTPATTQQPSSAPLKIAPIAVSATSRLEPMQKRLRREDDDAQSFSGHQQAPVQLLSLPPPVPRKPLASVLIEEVQTDPGSSGIVALHQRASTVPIVESPGMAPPANSFAGTQSSAPAPSSLTSSVPKGRTLTTVEEVVERTPQLTSTASSEAAASGVAGSAAGIASPASATTAVQGRSYRDAVAFAMQRSQRALAAANDATAAVPASKSIQTRRRRPLLRPAPNVVARCRSIVGWALLFERQLLHTITAAATAPAVATTLACGGGRDAVLSTVVALLSGGATMGTNVVARYVAPELSGGGEGGTLSPLQLQASSIVVVCGSGLKEAAHLLHDAPLPSTAMKVSALLRAAHPIGGGDGPTDLAPLRSGSMLLTAATQHAVVVGGAAAQHRDDGFEEFRQSRPYALSSEAAHQVRVSAARPWVSSRPIVATTGLVMTVDTNVACYCIDTTDLPNLHFRTAKPPAASSASNESANGSDSDDGRGVPPSGSQNESVAAITMILCLDLLTEDDWTAAVEQLTLLAQKGSSAQGCNGFRLSGVVFVVETPSADPDAMQTTIALIEDVFWEAWEAAVAPSPSRRRSSRPQPRPSTELDGSVLFDRPRGSMTYSTTRSWARTDRQTDRTGDGRPDGESEEDAWREHKQHVWDQLERLPAAGHDLARAPKRVHEKPTLVYLPIQEVLSTAVKHRQDPDECVRRALVSSLEALTSSYRLRSVDGIRADGGGVSAGWVAQGCSPVDVDISPDATFLTQHHRRDASICSASSRLAAGIGVSKTAAGCGYGARRSTTLKQHAADRISLAAAMRVPFE